MPRLDVPRPAGGEKMMDTDNRDLENPEGL